MKKKAIPLMKNTSNFKSKKKIKKLKKMKTKIKQMIKSRRLRR
jgi:hypothetical protein